MCADQGDWSPRACSANETSSPKEAGSFGSAPQAVRQPSEVRTSADSRERFISVASILGVGLSKRPASAPIPYFRTVTCSKGRRLCSGQYLDVHQGVPG